MEDGNGIGFHLGLLVDVGAVGARVCSRDTYPESRVRAQGRAVLGAARWAAVAARIDPRRGRGVAQGCRWPGSWAASGSAMRTAKEWLWGREVGGGGGGAHILEPRVHRVVCVHRG